MHPSLMADIAVQRQHDLLREADARRLRTGDRSHRRADAMPAPLSLTRWQRRLTTMVRPAPEPCCA
jgi:hypothetical protein